MRSIIMICIYLFTFAFFFFVLSLFGLLWNPTYMDCISSGGWFMCYTLFIGWWIAGFPAYEYYKNHEAELEEVWG